MNSKKIPWFNVSNILLLGIIVSFLVFLFQQKGRVGGIFKTVIASGPVIALDVRVANFLSALRSPGFNKFFFWVTLLGEWKLIALFALTLIIILWRRRQRIFILPLLVTLFGSEFFVGLGKIVFRRPRPVVAAFVENSFSFPSGHAAIALAFYGFLSFFIISQAKRRKTKIGVAFAGLALILFIGFSRLYFGVHYLSDVWSGYLIGALWLVIGISLISWLGLRRKGSRFPSPWNRRKTGAKQNAKYARNLPKNSKSQIPNHK